MRCRRTTIAALLAPLLVTACSSTEILPVPSELGTERATLLAVADVASCASTGDEVTAAIADTIPGEILIAGDIAYESGTVAEFNNCFNPSWGRHRARIHPAPGNHEYESPDATPYYAYFGTAAGPAGRGYYSFDVGRWHIISLNSNVAAGSGSAQEQWLRGDLASNSAKCTLAFWHHPLYSSGLHGSSPTMRDIWNALYDSGVDVVISGHDHIYERFAPQNANGVADAARGIREFIVGTGGRSLYPIVFALANSEKRSTATFGVLKLSLGPSDYQWTFIPVGGGSAVDSGSADCH